MSEPEVPPPAEPQVGEAGAPYPEGAVAVAAPADANAAGDPDSMIPPTVGGAEAARDHSSEAAPDAPSVGQELTSVSPKFTDGTASQEAMQHEEQKDEEGDHDNDTAGDTVVDLLDSDDEDGEAFTSGTGQQQPRVGDAGVTLPSSPPAAPGGGVGVAVVPPPPPAAAASTGGGGNDYSDDSDIEIVGTTAAPAPPPPPQQQQFAGLGVAPSGAAVAARASVIPEWMQKAAAEAMGAGMAVNSREFNDHLSLREQEEEVKNILTKRLEQLQYELYGTCQRGQVSADNGQCGRAAAGHVNNVPGHIPTWEFPIPFTRQEPQRQRYVPSTQKANAFKLSLLSCSDFTISPIQHPDDWNTPRGSLAGLRIHIKKAAKPHGGAKFERADDDGDDNDDNGDSTEVVAPVGPAGRWRIPLGAYEGLVGYLATLRDERGRSAYIERIDQRNLQLATMGRELKNKAYPSAQVLIDEGVPAGLAKALAPYQRGGVDFALHQDGRVLIADEMGLGKTIQAIAAMSAYATEWPLIVFSPSSARYHWQVEFNHWLGEDSVVNKPGNDTEGVDITSGINGSADDDKNPDGDSDGDVKISLFDEKKDDDDDGEVSANLEPSEEDPTQQRKRTKSPVPPMQLLRKSQVNVLTSSKDPLFPTADTQVVICSYGLAPNLIESGKIKEGMFKCAIVDESHMLKNKNTKRSRTILPILKKTTRCLLLSGTPALSRPMELWPQLSVLGNDRGWWNDESDFVRKYVNREEEAGGGGSALAELHTLLTSTVMIRRMKVDMLKNLPKKERHNARIRVTDEGLKDEFDRSMAILREGKGALGKLAREHQKEEDERKKEAEAAADASSNGNALAAGENTSASLPTIDIESVRYDAERKRRANIGGLQHRLMTELRNVPNLSLQPQLLHQLYNQRLGQEVDRINQEHQQFLSTVKAGSVYNNCRVVDKAAEEEKRKTILNHLYSLTGKAKVGHVVEMLNAWLDDPTKGKLCIFAHHIEILDEITKGAALSNAAGSLRKYIRIDGKTSPKARQEQMMEFQSDPTVRIAILGITAAGVAITLTAASTVWFAELFWTPAIMIQAEDRCHRIGQQATVKCLYIIAKGTLDEVLWKLVEKKFRQLGEFVEGKENLDIVVHQTFDCGLKAIAIDDGDDDDDDEEEDDDNGGEDGPKKKRLKRQRTSSFGDLADEDSIQHDIEELAKEEEAMLNIGLDDDDDNNGDAPAGSNNNAAKSSGGNTRGEGRNTAPEKKKTAVICLDDSDDEAEGSKKKSSSDNTSGGTGEKSDGADSSSPSATAIANQSVPTIADSITAIIKSGDYENGKIDRRARFGNLELYSVVYTGSTYGLSIVPFAGRAVVKSSANVSNLSPEQNERPACGDIIVKVGHSFAPLNHPFKAVLDYMKASIKRQNGLGVLVMFAHEPEFSRFFQETALPAHNQGKEEECRRIEEQLACFAAASAPEAANEAKAEARIPMASAPLPAAPAVSATAIATATTSNVPPEQDDEVIELLDD